MANSFFQFKQFRVQQDRCAMKVCTDACIFGASIQLPTGNDAVQVLDIGAGTGLLTLMVAQRHANASIQGIEIDEIAAQQANENVMESPFSAQIKIHCSSIQEFQLLDSQLFDVVLSNPPFFQDSLLSPSEKINKAHHNSTLSLHELLVSVLRFLKKSGTFWLLLPPFEMQKFEEIAAKAGLLLTQKTEVRHNSTKPILRVISAFAFRQPNDVEFGELAIYSDQKTEYSPAFQKLLKDYYTIF
jgi:tRNA1Val (adenine37-N6)-methyltransferase